MTIQTNVTYTPADPEWKEAIEAALAAELVEMWWDGIHGSRGKVTRDDVGHYHWLGGRHITRGGKIAVEVTSVKILEGPAPEWHGATVIKSRNGSGFRLRNGKNYTNYAGDSTPMTELRDDYIIVVDENSHIPVATLMELNGVTEAELFAAVCDNNGRHYFDIIDTVKAVIAALEGKSNA